MKKKLINGKQPLPGHIYISSSMNNVIISLTDNTGDVIKQMSPGKVGYKKSKRHSSFAGQMAMNNLTDVIMTLSIKEWYVFIKGFGQGRDGALKALSQLAKKRIVKVLEIRDITPYST